MPNVLFYGGPWRWSTGTMPAAVRSNKGSGRILIRADTKVVGRATFIFGRAVPLEPEAAPILASTEVTLW